MMLKNPRDSIIEEEEDEHVTGGTHATNPNRQSKQSLPQRNPH
jgi:hypothetical protein